MAEATVQSVEEKTLPEEPKEEPNNEEINGNSEVEKGTTVEEHGSTDNSKQLTAETGKLDKGKTPPADKVDRKRENGIDSSENANGKPVEEKTERPTQNGAEQSEVKPDGFEAADTRRRRSKRTSSIALSVSSTSSGHQTVSSIVFVKKALETLDKSKDARKIPALDSSIKKALKQLDENPHTLPSPTAVFEPLKIVCNQSANNELKVVALDCIAKLFTFSYLEDPESVKVDPNSGVTPPPQVPLIDKAVSTVCENYKNEATDPRVELQIIKALMAAVLNEDLVVHGSTILRAIRQTYTIFVLSHSNANQTIAQATLTQMVNVVFDRVKRVVNTKAASQSRNSSAVNVNEDKQDENVEIAQSEDSDLDTKKNDGEKLTLRQMESRSVTRSNEDEEQAGNVSDSEDENELIIKDAFLVFRTLCKLSEKPLEGDGSDTKSQVMRSKLLSLHLIHTILKAHMTVFLSDDVILKSNTKGEETFIVSVKDYVCSSLARNAASISPSIFEISAEIFWLVLSNLRGQFKKEIQVFFNEMYFPVMEMKTSTSHQKQYFLSILQKLSNDPRALVEIYLNYDCDRAAPVNIYEHIIDLLVKLAVVPIQTTQLQLQQYYETKHRPIAVYNLSLPPALSIANVTSNTHSPEAPLYPPEYALKTTGLASLVAVLRSLLTWSQRGIAAVSASLHDGSNPAIAAAQIATDSISANQSETSSIDNTLTNITTTSTSATSTNNSDGTTTPRSALIDDPTQFESFKHRKAALSEAISEFNYKPKRGLERLIQGGFVESKEPIVVASFLLNTEGLDKATIGEFLGDDDAYHVSVMHALVDLMDFKGLSFVDAMRRFLQAFRLPGEAQKIDRYMLKFAQRYISDNSSVFSNADTAYILAYSVILLNTDLHSPQIKKRMTPEEFIRNNRGINDRTDLPDEFLLNIYNDIQTNEIKLLSEQHAALLSSDGSQANSSGFTANLGLALATVGRDLQREAYMQASREMSNKTEKLFKELIAKDGRGKNRKSEDIFYIASHIEHVKPMFEVAWMSFLAGLSGPFQEGDELEVTKLCLEGFRLSIRIACLFDLELPRVSFVSSLAKFTNLQNLNEMKSKNVETVKVLLSIALTEGNMLKSSWKDVLTSVSQLERLQLIGSGISAESIPDVRNALLANASGSRKASMDSTRSAALFQQQQQLHNNISSISLEVIGAMRSREVVVSIDKIFTQSALLNGEGIVEFVKALTKVSWDEIQSSGQSQHPRMFSLQKMVDVSYYNMERIRVEWKQLWSIMGDMFNQVGCHENSNIVFFALDSLRQLSIRFFDLEELPHFKFQKDFLRPFEQVMSNNPDGAAKDMVLQCLKQMILAKSDKIKSGWKTMFDVFSAAANASYGGIVTSAFHLAKKIHDEHFTQLIQQDSFEDMTKCLASFAKNSHFQKTALHSVELLKSTIKDIIVLGDCKDLLEESADVYSTLWFPLLLSFHDITMNGEDLEVRSRALNYLFDILVENGGKFEVTFWNTICRQLLFPIFVILKSRSTKSQDEMSVWLSTTMIQALRNMIALLSHYFDILERMLDGFLELLVTCILQDNDTVSRIGSSCLQQLVVQNVERLQGKHWNQIVHRIEYLFQATTAGELFDSTKLEDDENARPVHTRTVSAQSVGIEQDPSTPVLAQREFGDLPTNSSTESVVRQRPKKFRGSVIKSILQLLLIETVEELIDNKDVFKAMPTIEILRIGKLLRTSYLFSRKFNGDRELRVKLWRQGFMKQMPNLLKQESVSALTYVTVMMRLYKDEEKLSVETTGNEDLRLQVGGELIPQIIEILKGYNGLEATEQRYISTLSPVVVKILNEYVEFSVKDFDATIQIFYRHLVELLSKNLVPEVRESLQLILIRFGESRFEPDEQEE